MNSTNPRHSLSPLVNNNGSKHGFYVEHILSRNQDNLDLFNGDEEQFEQERNRLGAIFLLKGRDNIFSGNEPYQEKLKSYANTLYWNETLRADSYKANLDFTELIGRYDLDLKPLEQFGPYEVEARHKVLFKLVELIWDDWARSSAKNLRASPVGALSGESR